MAGRVIGLARSGRVGLVRLLPAQLLTWFLHRDVVGGVMEPFMPLRRHPASFFLAIVHDPALLTAVIGAAPGGGGTAAVIAVSRPVTANQLAENPCIENGAG